jgi:antitoxin VapB
MERRMAHAHTAKQHLRGNRRTTQPDRTGEEETGTAKLFMHGRSQAVRLPKKFRLPGKEVRVRRMGNGVLLEPMEFDIDAWLARLDSYRDIPFMEEGREQPEMPDGDDISFDE